ncbi:cupin domain-containing protein [Amycolatopsis acidicola]|uniref:Cupin domain-containing protein n=1 Tax=Amycolatopsis acidicola TaxID=2596893 RepID=A0A5N0V583_9PSEU|nr:cupin domain-containing protein [Amycolatopsis acidicola]KAA9160538.1 cupin domain-containing protein [Amycolatopsis acidicola]
MEAEESEASIDGAVGARLRRLRREHKLSAKDVADAAHVSPAYLSRLEHGKISPTVATLTRIVQAMGESVGRLFGDDTAGPLVRRADRRIVHNRGVADEIITPAMATRLEVLETTVEPGAGSGPAAYHHPGDEECVLVLDGRLLVWLDGTEHDLREGDAVTFPCRTPHRWENPGDAAARVLWVITPAGY